MFTPPPSPRPPTTPPSLTLQHHQSQGPSEDNELTCSNDSLTTSEKRPIIHLDAVAQVPVHHTTEAKQKMTRRIRWSVLLVPAVLILVALSTQCIAHPAAFDFFTPALSVLASEENFVGASLANFVGTHGPHSTHHEKRSPDGSNSASPTPSSAVSGSLSATPSASASAAASTSLPDPTVQTVPDAPTTTVAVPTPFPQPFDTTLSNNFSTQGCSAFFTNMTQSDAFRQCRPFSLLYLVSSAFSNAQSNLTLLNSIIYGTCNTPISEQTCISNMQWFASELQTVCAIDLKNDIGLAQQGLAGLQAYTTMRSSGCLVNQVSGAFCFVEAAHSADPSDLFYYGIPLGTPVPNVTGNSQPSCDACTQSVMRLYVQAVASVEGLEATYPPAAQMANQKCGAGYVALDENGTSSAGRLWRGREVNGWVAVGVLVVVLGWEILL